MNNTRDHTDRPVLSLLAACAALWLAPSISHAETEAATSNESLEQRQRRTEEKVGELEQKNEELELELIRMDAESSAASGGEAAGQAEEEGNLESRTFTGGQRALQALNPELSIIGDGIGQAIFNRRGYTSASDRSGMFFRELEIDFRSDLDPFSFTKVALSFTPEEVEVEEAYVTWTSVLPNVNLSFGKLRQSFGVVNRWHTHALDQYELPVATRQAFGPEGLDQTGLSLEWLMPPLWADANRLTLQITNGENETAFAGRFFSIPASLLRLTSYYDLSGSTYFELGFSGMVGWNNARGVEDAATGIATDEPFRTTVVGGADWTIQWEPVNQAKYRNVVARGELYAEQKSTVGEPERSVGVYQYLQAKATRSFGGGARGDWVLTERPDGSRRRIWGAMPYLIWWQSPWVHLRLHAGMRHDDTLPRNDYRTVLQLIAAAGPHKHDRY